MSQNSKKLSFLQKASSGLLFYWEYPKFQGETFRDALKYILMLGLLIGAPSILPKVLESHKAAHAKLQWFEEKAPEFVVKDGALQVAGKTPLVFKTAGAVFAVDANGELKAGELLDDYPEGLILAKDRMFNKTDGLVRERLYHDLQKQYHGKSLAKKEFIQLLGLRMMAVYMFVIGLLSYYFFLFFDGLVISLCGLVAGKWLAVKLRFVELYRLTMYVLTLPMIFALLVNFLPVRSLLFTGIYYAIASIFLIRAIIGMNSGQNALPKRRKR